MLQLVKFTLHKRVNKVAVQFYARLDDHTRRSGLSLATSQ